MGAESKNEEAGQNPAKGKMNDSAKTLLFAGSGIAGAGALLFLSSFISKKSD